MLHSGKRSLPGGDDSHILPVELEKTLGHLLIDRLILHEEQRQRCLSWLPLMGMVRRGAVNRRDPADLDLDRECGALAKLAFDAKISAHCCYKPFGYGESKTGATLAPANGVGGLSERLEDKLQFIGWDANSGIAHGEHQTELILACGTSAYIDGDSAILCELYSVANNVE